MTVGASKKQGEGESTLKDIGRGEGPILFIAGRFKRPSRKDINRISNLEDVSIGENSFRLARRQWLIKNPGWKPYRLPLGCPPSGSITNYYAEGYDKDDTLPCGYPPGGCCAAGTGCLSCGENPELGKEGK
jgi:hypothetical protein